MKTILLANGNKMNIISRGKSEIIFRQNRLCTTDNHSHRHSTEDKKIQLLECLACASEESLKDEAQRSNDLSTIDHYLNELSMQRAPVPPDGHCILHSWQVSLASNGLSIELSTLKELVLCEIKSNLQFYQEFFPQQNLDEQLHEYINLRNYSSALVDMMVYALANATSTTCYIVSLQNSECRVTAIQPREGSASERSIHICKIGMHYDAVVDKDSTAVLPGICSII